MFSKPELLEIVAANATVTPKDVRRVASFKMRFQLMRSSDLKKEADAEGKAQKAQAALRKTGATNGN